MNGGADSETCSGTANSCGLPPIDGVIVCKSTTIPKTQNQEYHLASNNTCGASACTYCTDPDGNGICGTQKKSSNKEKTKNESDKRIDNTDSAKKTSSTENQTKSVDEICGNGRLDE